MVSEPEQAFEKISEEIFREVERQIDEDEALMEDIEYLSGLNGEIKDKASYILVRKGNDIYYTGNEAAASKIFDLCRDMVMAMRAGIRVIIITACQSL